MILTLKLREKAIYLLSKFAKSAKYIALASTLAGTLMICTFLISTKSPLPPTDTNFGIFVTTFMLYVFLFSVSFLVVCLSPLLFTPANHDFAKYNYSFMSTPIERYNPKERKLIVLMRITTYMFMFFPFILTVLFVSWEPMRKNCYSESCLIGTFAFHAFIFVASLLSFYFGVMDLLSLKKNKIESNKDIISFIIISLVENLFSMVWAIIFIYLIDTLIVREYFYLNLPLKISIDVIIIIFIHFLLCSSAISFNKVALLPIPVLYFAVGIGPGVTSITSFTLKTMGAGGSSPASIYVKEYTASSGVRLQKHNGCLMFSTGSFVVFRTAKDGNMKEEYCDIKYGLFYTGKENKVASVTFTFNRSDIHKIGDYE